MRRRSFCRRAVELFAWCCYDRPGQPPHLHFPYTTLFRSKPGRWSAKVTTPVPKDSKTGVRYYVSFDQFPQQRRSYCRSEEHTSELQSLTNLVCRLLPEKKKSARPPAPQPPH